MESQELENKLSLMCCCIACTHGTLIVYKKFILERLIGVFKIEYEITLKRYPRISRYLLNWRNQTKSE